VLAALIFILKKRRDREVFVTFFGGLVLFSISFMSIYIVSFLMKIEDIYVIIFNYIYFLGACKTNSSKLSLLFFYIEMFFIPY